MQSFTHFDVLTFYPAIDKKMMLKSLNCAKKNVSSEESEIGCILQVCEVVLKQTWYLQVIYIEM